MPALFVYVEVKDYVPDTFAGKIRELVDTKYLKLKTRRHCTFNFLLCFLPVPQTSSRLCPIPYATST